MDGQVFCEMRHALAANSSPLTHVLRGNAFWNAGKLLGSDLAVLEGFFLSPL